MEAAAKEDENGGQKARISAFVSRIRFSKFRVMTDIGFLLIHNACICFLLQSPGSANAYLL